MQSVIGALFYEIHFPTFQITFDGPYFLAISRHKLSVFGLPVVVPCQSKTSKELYASVWKQTERLISKDSKFSQR